MLKLKLTSLLKNASVYGLVLVTSAAPTWAQGIRQDSRFVYAQPTSACCQSIASHVAGAAIPGYPMALQALPHAWADSTIVQGQCACDGNGVNSIIWDDASVGRASSVVGSEIVCDTVVQDEALILSDDRLSVLED